MSYVDCAEGWAHSVMKKVVLDFVSYGGQVSIVVHFGPGLAGMANFKCISSVSFVQIESKFFYNTQEIQTQKNDGPEFWNSNSVIFENFLKFSKMRHAVPLWPIWTIMVEAKLDQSRVLVTKFHQNRLTLKGRSAVRVTQRHRQTDSQTNSAENNGSSSLQSGQYTYPLTYSPAAHMGHWATQVTGNPGKPEK